MRLASPMLYAPFRHLGWPITLRRSQRFTGSENPTDTTHPNNVATPITAANIHHTAANGLPHAANTAEAAITTNMCVR